MPQAALIKLTKINAQIQALEVERKEIREKLNQAVLDLINQNSFALIDFETFIGGILSIQKLILSDDLTLNAQKALWKKEGSAYQSIRKKSKN